MSFIDEAYLEHRKNINKPDVLDLQWLTIDSNEYIRLLFEYGELHVTMSQFTQVRDHVQMLWGSVKNWLETQPPQKAAELSAIVSKTVNETESKNKYDMALGSFNLSLQNGKIGETYQKDEGSYCLDALMAYKVFYNILCEIISTYGIPETNRDMPLYPEYDYWVTENIFKNAYEEAELVCSVLSNSNDGAIYPNEAMLAVEELIRTVDATTPKHEEFRRKVTSCCEVCKSLDDICQAERLMKNLR